MVHIVAASSLHQAVKIVRYSEKKELLTKIITIPGLYQPQYKESVEKCTESSRQGQIEHMD